jgi:hypothetical protein
MSVSLAWHPAQNLLAAHADNVTPALATEPFAVGPGALLILVILGLVLLVAIGQVLTLVCRVIREALPILGVLLVGLGVVVMVGAATLTNSGGTPDGPATTSSPTARPTAGTPAPRRSSRPVPPATSLAPRGSGVRPTHR